MDDKPEATPELDETTPDETVEQRTLNVRECPVCHRNTTTDPCPTCGFQP